MVNINFAEETVYVLGFDTDWAPQYMLDFVLNKVAEAGLPSTFFCTNKYDFSRNNNVELALHPNFMDDSTQGDSEETVLSNLLNIYPKAVGSRSHRLFWHSGLRKLLPENSIKYDASIPTPGTPYLAPYKYGSFYRFPIWWTDAFYLVDGGNMASFKQGLSDKPGLRALIFHPVHIFFNTRDVHETLVNFRCAIEKSYTGEEALKLLNPEEGVRDLFLYLLSFLQKQKHVYFFKDLIL